MAVRIALAYGLGTAVLGVLTLMAGRMGWLDPWLIRIGLGADSPLRRAGEHPRALAMTTDAWKIRRRDWLPWLLAAIAPFVVIMLLGSMLPATDFDVLEYHLQGPKEYFQAGRISFLPHNVYTNMPFGVEMLHLLGMEVMGDWWWGAGRQLLVALFAPAAAVLIAATAAAARRERAGSRRSSTSRRRGSTAGGDRLRRGAALLLPRGVGLGRGRGWATTGRARRRPIWLLLGLLAGGAMGCKYTALISAVIPFGPSRWSTAWRSAVAPARCSAYVLGWAIVMGPWLVKNVIDTGDPVYPLGYQRLPRPLLGRCERGEVARLRTDRNGRRSRQELAELDRRRGGPVRLAIAAVCGAGPAGVPRARHRGGWRWLSGASWSICS